MAQAPAAFELETAPPQVEAAGEGVLRLSGFWTADHSQAVEEARAQIAAKIPSTGNLTLDKDAVAVRGSFTNA